MAVGDGGSFTHSASSGVGKKNPSLSLLPAAGLPLPCCAELHAALYFHLHRLFSPVGAVDAH